MKPAIVEIMIKLVKKSKLVCTPVLSECQHVRKRLLLVGGF